jgi:hypothetical protein
METFLEFARFCAALIALKAVIIGSDFNFIKWIKYRKKYTNWYFNRQEFHDV